MKQGTDITQTQNLQQVQTLSPQQVLAVKLLELPAMEFEERVKTELQDNPALKTTTPTTMTKTFRWVITEQKMTYPTIS